MSDLIESVANTEENKIEVISSEDMLHNVEESNKKSDKIHEEWMRARMKKMNCQKCQTQHLRCAPHISKRGGGDPVQDEAPP